MKFCVFEPTRSQGGCRLDEIDTGPLVEMLDDDCQTDGNRRQERSYLPCSHVITAPKVVLEVLEVHESKRHRIECDGPRGG